MSAARRTTVRGGRIADGERNCCSVAFVPVVGSVNVVAVDLSVQLEHLAYKVQNTPGGVSYAG